MFPLSSVHSALLVLRVRLGPTAQLEQPEQLEPRGRLVPVVQPEVWSALWEPSERPEKWVRLEWLEPPAMRGRLEPPAQPGLQEPMEWLGPPEQPGQLEPTGLWGRLGWLESSGLRVWLEREILESPEQWAYCWQRRAWKCRALTRRRARKCRAPTSR